MSLDEETVRTIAKLARLKIGEENLTPMAGELSHIFTWIERLNEVDTEGVDPMTSVLEVTLPWREDKITDGDDPERVLTNAPDRKKDFFAVPKVVE